MSRLDLPGLLALTSKANIAQIELSTLQELYYKCLYPYTFVFKLDNGDELKLKFDRDKFCHLIGLDKVPKALLASKSRGWTSRRVSNYKGVRGWDGILDGSINIAHINALAARVRNGLGESERKLVNFYYLPTLLKVGNLVIRYLNPQPGSRVTSELFIYDTHDNLYLQLGLRKDSNNYDKWYYPETFIINTANPGNSNPRAAGNPVHRVVKRTVLQRFNYGLYRPKSRILRVPNSKRKNRRVKN
ncbi:PBECR4 domain-containing protein [Paenibacillus herberti]|uniref:Phage-Barnase-EndoU-ColicinE5/D-RelE like nuclease 4 domain-containing protein n=1 Tax=Paenibacillus herberti TaxID=1619309 RepID=A0A229NYQ5_9BACL|nr:hypothetical protein CGZ75_18065 [Paenibacillus herberti]